MSHIGCCDSITHDRHVLATSLRIVLGLVSAGIS